MSLIFLRVQLINTVLYAESSAGPGKGCTGRKSNLSIASVDALRAIHLTTPHPQLKLKVVYNVQ